MKKSLVMFMFGTILSVFAGYSQKIDIQKNVAIDYYRTANDAVFNGESMKGKVVFIGNSITEGWVGTHADFFKSNEYIGRGISGQTTPQFLLRFRRDVINLRPEIVVINGGINDIAENTGSYDPRFTLENIISMTELAQKSGIKVILSSVLPAAGIPWDKEITDVPDKIETLNKMISDYAVANGITYVDYYSQMVGEDRGMIAEYTTDGVHVTPKGYTVMESVIKEAIDSLQ